VAKVKTILLSRRVLSFSAAGGEYFWSSLGEGGRFIIFGIRISFVVWISSFQFASNS
jgi:hypothetical protein